MKIIKRNQLIVLVISLMLITAGYLNYTSTHENVITSTIADRSDTKIGDAELVSTIPDNSDLSSEQVVTGLATEEEANQTNQLQETATQKEDYYFTTSKLERNNIYSESLETYQEMYNNSNATAEQKSDALNKINKINNTKNAIMIAENLIIAKGFEDVVIFSNEGSVSVIVKTQELKQEEVAQIQNIVSRELSVGAEIIHISNK